ncbi:MAG: F0F1 ATP synthase subunit epsilon [Planctomycetaceae bacterium]|nr:F0F1 ATP synthase subunit epsilon [Planctomycetaceae bacterium]
MPAPLKLVLVTPEKTLIDQTVDALRFPLFDGQIGILPGRAPLLGRLGTGELEIEADGTKTSWFIDGGFAQMRGGVVSLLTNRAKPVSDLDPAQAKADLEVALSRPATTEEQLAARQREQDRARSVLALVNRR